jgi:putative transcriptional regulator
MPMTEKQLRERDAKRDLGAELLLSVRQMKAGLGKVVARIEMPPVTAARMKSGLSQADFAKLLGVSVRTLQDWEQGRRQPSGAARTLITIAEQQPKVLKQVFKDLAETAST